MRSEGYGNPEGRSAEIAVVEAILDAVNRNDVEAALQYCHPDLEMSVPRTQAALGRDEPYRGHAGMREYFADLQRAWGGTLRLYPEDPRVVAGSIVVFGHAEGRLNDQVLSRRVVWTWRIRDGLAVSVHANDLGDRMK